MSAPRIRALLGEPAAIEAALAALPAGTRRVELVIPAAQVLLARAKLPPGLRRRSASMLAFAVEEQCAAEPEASLVSWLGVAGGNDILAVLDRPGLERWRDALHAAGVRVDAVLCETLLLPLAGGEWSLAWDGAEGFVRTGEFEGAALDRGDDSTPPLALRLLLEAGERPGAIALYGASPDLAAWQRALGLPLRFAGAWDWRSAPAGAALTQERRRWRLDAALAARLRPAAWIAGAALAIHAAALVGDWMLLAAEQRSVRAQMEARFRRAFPDAVAVADPVLQMRRQLAAARHRAGLADAGDFTPMIEKIAGPLKELPAGTVRSLSYESGRLTLEVAAAEGIAGRLARTGLIVDVDGKRVTVRSP